MTSKAAKITKKVILLNSTL